MKNKAKRNVFILSLCVVAAIPFAGKSATFESTPVDKKEVSINSTSIAVVLSDDEANIFESSLDKCDYLISFMESNFTTFVSEYNDSPENSKELEASYIEYTNYTYIIEDETYGVYFDFDEDNGYAVISPNYEIYGLEVSGDLVELKEYDTLMYSGLDGFVYYDENDVLQRIYDDYQDEYCYNEYADESPYPGQEKAGDGLIDNSYIEEYVATRYDDYKYESKNEKLASSFDCGLMQNSEYYRRVVCDESGQNIIDTYTEGNCSLNAMFNVVRNWAKCSLIKGVDYTSTADISKTIKDDPLYEEYGTKILRSREVEASEEKETKTYSSEGTVTEYYYWEPTLTSRLEVMPILNSNIRNYAVNNYGYTPESGFLASNVPNTIESTLASCYGTSVNVSYTSSIEEAISSIDNGKAAYMSITNSSTYGNHGVVLIGYQMYSYKTGWWIFKSTHYVYFYEIADGWRDVPKYFDPNTDANPSLCFCVLEN